MKPLIILTEDQANIIAAFVDGATSDFGSIKLWRNLIGDDYEPEEIVDAFEALTSPLGRDSFVSVDDFDRR